MAAIAITPPRKLPVWQSVRASYAIVTRNLGQFARIVWLWLLLMVPVHVALGWLVQAIPAAAGSQAAFGWVRAVAEALPLPIELPFMASIAVAWHRLVLRQERVTRPAYLRFDRVVWRYTLCSFALFLMPRGVPVICALLVSFLAYAVVLPDAIAVMLIDIISAEPFIVLVMAIVLLLLPRLVLVLPGVALGAPLSLRHAWRITRANTLRLGLATFLCVLPALSVAMLGPFLKLLARAPWWLDFSWPQIVALMWAWDLAIQLSQSHAYAVFSTLAYVCLSIFGITLLSLTYRFFVAPDHASPA